MEQISVKELEKVRYYIYVRIYWDCITYIQTFGSRVNFSIEFTKSSLTVWSSGINWIYTRTRNEILKTFSKTNYLKKCSCILFVFNLIFYAFNQTSQLCWCFRSIRCSVRCPLMVRYCTYTHIIFNCCYVGHYHWLFDCRKMIREKQKCFNYFNTAVCMLSNIQEN